jgi:hypothetical protein
MERLLIGIIGIVRLYLLIVFLGNMRMMEIIVVWLYAPKLWIISAILQPELVFLDVWIW